MPKRIYEITYEAKYCTTVTVDEDAGETLPDVIADIDIPENGFGSAGSHYLVDTFQVVRVTDKANGQDVPYEEDDGPCDECGEDIPVESGGSVSNKHHDPSCSLYSPNEE